MLCSLKRKENNRDLTTYILQYVDFYYTHFIYTIRKTPNTVNN